MERLARTGVTQFFAKGPLAVGELALDEEGVRHAYVRRQSVGDGIQVTDGVGHRARGRISGMTKKETTVTIDEVDTVPKSAAVHLYVPVADRDRMLWLAEKATELQIASWHPVMYRRSRSVSPKGEGEAFDRKLRARMIAALEQSGNAWLPSIEPVQMPDALRPIGAGVLLDRGGAPLETSHLKGPVSVAVGPEGGVEADELQGMRGNGWSVASLGDITLRFETAAIAAIAIARLYPAP